MKEGAPSAVELNKAGGAGANNPGQIAMSDIYLDPSTKKAAIDIYAPLVTTSGGKTANRGTLVLTIDPEKAFYRFVRQTPEQLSTFETVIVRRENDKALFLDTPRHITGNPLTFSLDNSNKDSPAVMAINGVTGIVEGKDYRGVPVLASIKQIPDSPWFLICKIDNEEVYGAVRSMSLAVALFILLFFVLAGAVIGLVWYRQNSLYLKKEYERELEKKAVAKHIDYLIKYANDIIMLYNTKFEIVEANDSAVSAYGYTRPELIGMDSRKLRSEEGLKTFDRELQELSRKGSLVFETEHKRKDGTVFPVEISTRVIVIEWKEFYQSIIRDISPRKKTECAPPPNP
jgi:PAS domain S-box-containing protein